MSKARDPEFEGVEFQHMADFWVVVKGFNRCGAFVGFDHVALAWNQEIDTLGDAIKAKAAAGELWSIGPEFRYLVVTGRYSWIGEFVFDLAADQTPT